MKKVEKIFGSNCYYAYICVQNNKIMSANLTKKKPNKKAVNKVQGTNIRFSEDAHKAIVNFCQNKGYKIGLFCETAALERIESEKK